MPRLAGRARVARRGVTLLELLVVLLLMAITASLVLPTLLPPAAAPADNPSRAVVTTARLTAIRRGEPVRLRVDADGVWALVVARDGRVIDGGRIRTERGAASARSRSAGGPSATAASLGGGAVASDGDVASGSPASVVNLTIDALGNCLPGATGQLDGATLHLDPLACTWRAP